MLRFLVLTSLAALVLAELEPQPRYVEDSVDRVVGGKEARPNSWPWQISLQAKHSLYRRYYDRRIRGPYVHVCGGTLIGRHWVMTAAHCVDRFWRLWQVVLGEHDRSRKSGTEQTISVRRFYIHPKWKRGRMNNGYDIALLRLSSSAYLNSYVKLGSLPPSGQILPNTTSCFITGWGRNSTGGRLSPVLKEASVPLVDHATCTRPDWYGSSIKTSMVCAGDSANAACNGDFGGPLNCLVNGKYYVYGITSFVSNKGCDAPKKPTVFTRVSAYIEWMNAVSLRHT